MASQDTIVATASPPGRGPRAIIRVSGPDAWPLLASVSCAPLDRARTTQSVVIALTPNLSLPALAITYVRPHSYTGEDSIELIVPGNPCVVARVIQALLASATPARLATPGEFTARAYLNGLLDLSQAEGVAAMIAARSKEQLSAARRLLAGVEGRRYQRWADELLTLLALVEAGIDFTDQEDVVAIAPRELDARLAVIESEMQAAGARAQSAAAAVPTVALVGPPNAGKSTLFNTLLASRRAVTSPEAGTTRDVLRERLDLSPHVPFAGTVELLDLPGLDESVVDQGPSARAAQSAAHAAIAAADILLQCDPAGNFPPIAGVSESAHVIRIQTKADRISSGPSPAAAIAVCALDGWHIGPLRRAIADAAFRETSAHGDAVLIPRHQAVLRSALLAILAARSLLQGAGPALPDPALLAGALRTASEALGDLTGKVSPDDVLGRIFSTFCIGK